MSSSSYEPPSIVTSNISDAWRKTFLRLFDHPGKEISPFVVTLIPESGTPFETPEIRDALDRFLVARQLPNIETVAWTIFPTDIWALAGGNRARLFSMYRSAYPRYRALKPAQNSRGLYFGRLIEFGRGPEDGNQLEWIISQYTGRRGVRRSMFQAAVFDPARDHVAQAQLGFPCLQHIQLQPSNDGYLALNAFYATQQLLDKAYGNWLGLCNLGRFMADQMGLEFRRLNCFVGIEKLERVTKSELRSLAAEVRTASPHP